MLFNPFIIPAVLIGISTYHELMFAKAFEGCSKPAKEETKEVPKGFYKCVDCGSVCKRTSSSQIRCPECQKVHSRILDRQRKKNKK